MKVPVLPRASTRGSSTAAARSLTVGAALAGRHDPVHLEHVLG